MATDSAQVTQEQEVAIQALALTYHHTVEGEYGCPGLTCPGVQRLSEFGKLCAQAALTVSDACPQEKDAAVLAAAERAFDEPPPEIHRCRVCGTLWHRWQNGSYSLIENRRAKPCCDNAPMGAQIEQLWPVTSSSPIPSQALRALETERVIRAAFEVIESLPADYDWNADPFYLTLIEGAVLQMHARRSPPEVELLAVSHARKQGAADGFQQGWHAALTRIREGDSPDALASLLPANESARHTSTCKRITPPTIKMFPGDVVYDASQPCTCGASPLPAPQQEGK